MPKQTYQWYAVQRKGVSEVLLSATFSSVDFVYYLLDPRVKIFQHVLPPPKDDDFLAYPGQDHHGNLVGKMYESVIHNAMDIHYYLQHPYVVKGLPYIYIYGRTSPKDHMKLVLYIICITCHLLFFLQSIISPYILV